MAISVSGAGYCGDVGRMEVGYVCSGLSRGDCGGRRGGCATGGQDAVAGIRAWGRFMWKGVKISVVVGLVVGTLGALSNMSLGLGPRSRQ